MHHIVVDAVALSFHGNFYILIIILEGSVQNKFIILPGHHNTTSCGNVFVEFVPSNFIFGIKTDKFMVETKVDILSIDHFHQGIRNFLNPKNNTSGDRENHIGLLAYPTFSKMALCQIHYFLRCPSTFNWGGRLCEQCRTALKILDYVPSMPWVGVITTYYAFVHRLPKTRYQTKIVNQTWGHYQIIIGQIPTYRSMDDIVFGVKSRCFIHYPFSRFWNHFGHWSSRLVIIISTGPDQCPSGLVIMDISRFDDGNVLNIFLLDKLCGRHDPCSATTNNNNLIMRFHGLGYLDLSKYNVNNR